MGKYVITNCDDISGQTTKNSFTTCIYRTWCNNAANVLKSKKTRQTSIAIVRAFISLKRFVLNYREISEKLQELESKYNKQFKDVYEAINYLLQKDKQETVQKERKRIGFKTEK